MVCRLIIIIFISYLNSLNAQQKIDYSHIVNSVGVDSAISMFMYNDYITLNIGYDLKEKMIRHEYCLGNIDFFEQYLTIMRAKNTPDEFLRKRYGFYAMAVIDYNLDLLRKTRCDVFNAYLKLLIKSNRKKNSADFYQIENQCHGTEFLSEILFGIGLLCSDNGDFKSACEFFRRSCDGNYKLGCEASIKCQRN